MSQDIKLLLKRCPSLEFYTSDVIFNEKTSTASTKVKVSKCHRWRVEQNTVNTVAEPQIIAEQEDLQSFQPENILGVMYSVEQDLEEMEMAPTLLGLLETTGSSAVPSSCVRQQAFRGRNSRWRSTRPLSLTETPPQEQKIVGNSMDCAFRGRNSRWRSTRPLSLTETPPQEQKTVGNSMDCAFRGRNSRWRSTRPLSLTETPPQEQKTVGNSMDCVQAKCPEEIPKISMFNTDQPFDISKLQRDCFVCLDINEANRYFDPVDRVYRYNYHAEGSLKEETKSSERQQENVLSADYDRSKETPSSKLVICGSPSSHEPSVSTNASLNPHPESSNNANLTSVQNESCAAVLEPQSVSSIQEPVCEENTMTAEQISKDRASSAIDLDPCVKPLEVETGDKIVLKDNCALAHSFVCVRQSMADLHKKNVGNCECSTMSEILSVQEKEQTVQLDMSNTFSPLVPERFHSSQLTAGVLCSSSESEAKEQVWHVSNKEAQCASQVLENKYLSKTVPDDDLAAIKLSECDSGIKDQVSEAKVQSHAMCVTNCIKVIDIAIQKAKDKESSVDTQLLGTKPKLLDLQACVIETHSRIMPPENKQMDVHKITETNIETHKSLPLECETDSQIIAQSHANKACTEPTSCCQANVRETAAAIQLSQDVSIKTESICSNAVIGTKHSENTFSGSLVNEVHSIESRKGELKMEQMLLPENSEEDEETEFITLEEEICQLGLFDGSSKESDKKELETDKLTSDSSDAKITDHQRINCVSSRRKKSIETPVIENTFLQSSSKSAVVEADIDKLPETPELKVLSHDSVPEQEVPIIRDGKDVNLKVTTHPDVSSIVCQKFVSGVIDRRNDLVANRKQLSCIEKQISNLTDLVLPKCVKSKQEVVSLNKDNNVKPNKFTAVTSKIKKGTNVSSAQRNQLASKSCTQKLKLQKTIFKQNSFLKTVGSNNKQRDDRSFFINKKSKSRKVRADQTEKIGPSVSNSFNIPVTSQISPVTSVDDHLPYSKSKNSQLPQELESEKCAENNPVKTKTTGLPANLKRNEENDDHFTTSKSSEKSIRKLVNKNYKKSKEKLLNSDLKKSCEKHLSSDLMKSSEQQVNNDLIKELPMKVMDNGSHVIEKDFASRESTVNMRVESETKPAVTNKLLSVTVYTVDADTNGSLEVNVTSNVLDSKADTSFVTEGSEDVRLDEMSDFEEERLDNIPLYEVHHSTKNHATSEAENVLNDGVTDKVDSKNNSDKKCVLDDSKRDFNSETQNTINVNNTKPYVCDICGKRFAYKYNVKRHQNVKHCGTSFSISSNSLCANNNEIHKVEICGKKNRVSRKRLMRTKNHKNLQSLKIKHTKKDLPAKFFCAACPKKFNKKCNLSCHIKFNHLPYNRKKRCKTIYTCHPCRLDFPSKRQLRIHNRVCLNKIIKKSKRNMLANSKWKVSETLKTSEIKNNLANKSVPLRDTTEGILKRAFINRNNSVNTEKSVFNISTYNENKISEFHKLNKHTGQTRNESQVVPENVNYSQMVKNKTFLKSFPSFSVAENVLNCKTKKQSSYRKLKVKMCIQTLSNTKRRCNKGSKYRNNNAIIQSVPNKTIAWRRCKYDNQVNLFVCGMCQMTFELKSNFETHKKTPFHMTNLFRQQHALQTNPKHNIATEKEQCFEPTEVENSLSCTSLVEDNSLTHCSSCSAAFNTQEELTVHHIEHPSHMFSDSLATSTESAPVKITPTSYYCSECNQTFQCFSDMSQHVRVCRNYKICYLESLNPLKENVKKELDVAVLPQSNVYNCDNCDENFNSSFLLERHNVAYHNIRKQRTCCDVVVLDTDEDENEDVVVVNTKEEQEKTNNGSELLKSTSSSFGASTISNQQLTQLLTTVHSKIININNICSLCNINWNSFDELVSHIMQIHAIKINYAYDLLNETKSVTCDLCLRKFKFKCLLRKHIKFEHRFKFEEIFFCEICTYNTFMLSRLKHHMKAEHRVDLNDANPIITELQKKEFRKACKCETCQATYLGKSELKKHIFSTHLPVPIHFCSHCHFSTLEAVKLSQHKTVVHKIKKKRKVLFQKRASIYRSFEERNYMFKCNSCDFTTKYRSHLGVHFKNKHPMFDIEKFVKITQGDKTVYQCQEKGCNFIKNSLTGIKSHYVFVHIKSCNRFNLGCYYGTVIYNDKKNSPNNKNRRVKVKSEKKVTEKVINTTSTSITELAGEAINTASTSNTELKVVLERCNVSNEQPTLKLSSKSSYGEKAMCFGKNDSGKDAKSLDDNLRKGLFGSTAFSCAAEVSNHVESSNSSKNKMGNFASNQYNVIHPAKDSNVVQKELIENILEQRVNIIGDDCNFDSLKNECFAEKLNVNHPVNTNGTSTLKSEITDVPKSTKTLVGLEEISFVKNYDVCTVDTIKSSELKAISLDPLNIEDKNTTAPTAAVAVKGPEVKVTPKKKSPVVSCEQQQHFVKKCKATAINNVQNLKRNPNVIKKILLLSRKKSSNKQGILSSTAVVSNNEIFNSNQTASAKKLPVALFQTTNETAARPQVSLLLRNDAYLEPSKNDVECAKTNIVNNRINEIQVQMSLLKKLLWSPPQPMKQLHITSPKISCATKEKSTVNNGISKNSCKIKLRCPTDESVEMPVLSQCKVKPETNLETKDDKREDNISESHIKTRKNVFVRYKNVLPKSENFTPLSLNTKASRQMSQDYSHRLEMKLNKNHLKPTSKKIAKNVKEKKCKLVKATECRNTRSQTKKSPTVENIAVLQLPSTTLALKEPADSHQSVVPVDLVKLPRNIRRCRFQNNLRRRVRRRPHEYFTRHEQTDDNFAKSCIIENSEIKPNKIDAEPKKIRPLKNETNGKAIQVSKIKTNGAVSAIPRTKLKQKISICKKYKHFTRSQHIKRSNDLTVFTHKLDDNLDKDVDVDYSLTQLTSKNILSKKLRSKSENSDTQEMTSKNLKHSKTPATSAVEMNKKEVLVSTLKNLRSTSNTNLQDNQSDKYEELVAFNLPENKMAQNTSILLNHLLVPAEQKISVLKKENKANHPAATAGKGNNKSNVKRKIHKEDKSKDSASIDEKASKEIDAAQRNCKQNVLRMKPKVSCESSLSSLNINQVVAKKRKHSSHIPAPKLFDPSVPSCSWSNNFEMVPDQGNTSEISNCSQVPAGDSSYSEDVDSVASQLRLTASCEKFVTNILQPTDQLNKDIHLLPSVSQEDKPGGSLNILHSDDKSSTEPQRYPANLLALPPETSPHSSCKVTTEIQKKKSVHSDDVSVLKMCKRPVSKRSAVTSKNPALQPIKPKKIRSLSESTQENEQEINNSSKAMQVVISDQSGATLANECVVSKAASSSTSTGLRCEICKNILSNTQCLRRHKERVHKIKAVKYDCKLCSFFCYCEQRFKRHINFHMRKKKIVDLCTGTEPHVLHSTIAPEHNIALTAAMEQTQISASCSSSKKLYDTSDRSVPSDVVAVLASNNLSNENDTPVTLTHDNNLGSASEVSNKPVLIESKGKTDELNQETNRICTLFTSIEESDSDGKDEGTISLIYTESELKFIEEQLKIVVMSEDEDSSMSLRHALEEKSGPCTKLEASQHLLDVLLSEDSPTQGTDKHETLTSKEQALEVMECETADKCINNIPELLIKSQSSELSRENVSTAPVNVPLTESCVLLKSYLVSEKCNILNGTSVSKSKKRTHFDTSHDSRKTLKSKTLKNSSSSYSAVQINTEVSDSTIENTVQVCIIPSNSSSVSPQVENIDFETVSRTSGAFRCEICNKSVGSVKSLRRHKKLVHNVLTKVIDSTVENTVQVDTVPSNPLSASPQVVENVDSEISRTSVAFRCEICNKTLSSIQSLRRHKKSVHNILTKVIDSNVENTVQVYTMSSNPSSASPHSERVARTSGAFRCEICNTTLSSIQSLRRHKKLLHNILTKVIDSNVENTVQVDTVPSNPSSVSPHSERVARTSGAFRCEICNTTLSSIQSLRRHKKLVHNILTKVIDRTIENGVQVDTMSSNPSSVSLQIVENVDSEISRTSGVFRCEICSKTLSSIQSLRRHKKLVHSILTKVIDSTVENTTEPSNPSSASPQIVENVDSETISFTSGVFRCEICNICLTTVRGLRRHKKSVHNLLTSKNYCELCTFSCYSEQFFQRHLMSHTKRKLPVTTAVCTPSNTLLSAESEGDASESASNENIVTNAQDQTTEQIEPETSKYRCCICSSSCKLRSSIQRHYRMSHDLQVFCCTQCFYCTIDKSMLQDHMSSHEGKENENQSSLSQQHVAQTTNAVLSFDEATTSSQDETKTITKKTKSTVKDARNDEQFSATKPTTSAAVSTSQKRKKTKIETVEDKKCSAKK